MYQELITAAWTIIALSACVTAALIVLSASLSAGDENDEQP